MRIILYGAGGVGGTIGAQLHRAGLPVVLIARGRHLEVLRRRGLRYQTPTSDGTLSVPVAGHPSEIAFRDGDIVLLTVKSQHTVTALEDLRAAAGDGIPVVCAQNGVANERTALRRFGRVFGMVVYLYAEYTEPGHVRCFGSPQAGVMDLGRYPGGADPLAAGLADILEAAGIASRADPDIMRFKYAKLLTNLGNGLEALSPRGESARTVRTLLKQEGHACLRAAGIAWASAAEVDARLDGRSLSARIDGEKRSGGSTHQSVLRRTGDIEVDYLNGEITQLGRLFGVATPANTVVQRLANDLARQGGAPGSVPADSIAAAIAREAALASP